MNSYLKEIADVCGIQKNLSTHTAVSYTHLFQAGDKNKAANLLNDIISNRTTNESKLSFTNAL